MAFSNTRHVFLLTALVSWGLTPVISARAQTFETESGHAEFTSRIPMHTFTGRSDHLVGMINFADSTVDFYLDLETLETGIGKRDRDMRLTLQTDTFPFAEFTGKLLTAVDQTLMHSQPVTVEGTFTIHGIPRQLEVSGSLEPDEDRIRLVAAWELNLEDYDIIPPRLLIVKVDKVQRIRIDADLRAKKE